MNNLRGVCQEVNSNDNQAGDASSNDNVPVQPASNSLPPQLGNSFYYFCQGVYVIRGVDLSIFLQHYAKKLSNPAHKSTDV